MPLFWPLQPASSDAELNLAGSTDYVERVVYALTDSTFEGRETGTLGEGLASAWLDSEFGALGFQAKGIPHLVKRSGTNHIHLCKSTGRVRRQTWAWPW